MTKIRYEVGEIVLAVDKATIYEAKIIKVQEIKNIRSYFIHFNGWHRKYDVWIDDDKIARKDDTQGLANLKKITEEYFQIGSKEIVNAQEKFINQLQKGSKGKKGKVSIESGKEKEKEKEKETETEVHEDDAEDDESEEEAKPDSSKKKRKFDSISEHLEVQKKRKTLLQQDLIDGEESEIAVKLPIPKELKKILVEDWRAITRNPQKLIPVPVPSNLSVDSIVKDFLTKHSDSAEYKVLFNGLKIQFNKALPTILQFRQEREQLEKVMEIFQDENYSKVYGLQHLLRFFVRLPKLMYNMVLPSADLNRILSHFCDFLKFLEKNSATYTKDSEYVLAIEAIQKLENLQSEG